MQSMKAIILHTPGPPDTLKPTQHPIPIPKPGELRIRIKAFGLNRSDLLTRQGHGHHPISYPRIPGIEAVGIVDAAPGLEHTFPPGSIVATAMGGAAPPAQDELAMGDSRSDPGDGADGVGGADPVAGA
ncbi:hypothetical protein CNMCM8980_006127 [Aspergillus fumigatiaffinis]|uniref:Alcohol dehydrogenase-like N-terminal domain-containing protein n=1 Tax=Aspergillus fumigatiaffinis TaxID=340414 RepID=A0A8H4M1S9_9EURO|nr:hypothetical protein CNMCM6805_005314 [Aspergillus fumigatiaffinis]KAF4229746.1 hypothetical protein CNMCM8980_006127 [Aspergillus fumigatiaffinis]